MASDPQLLIQCGLLLGGESSEWLSLTNTPLLPSPKRGGAGGGVRRKRSRSMRGIVAGQRVSREKLDQARDLRRRMTPAEQRLWSYLRGHQLGRFQFRRQQVIDGFIVDFYCHQANLVVEADGPIHDQQVESAHQRDEALGQRDLRVLRFSNDEVLYALDSVLTRISEVLG